MRRLNPPQLSILAGFLLVLQASCGGGGGGGGAGGAPPSAQTTTVSGSVQAPGGQVAFSQPSNLLQQFSQFIAPSAYATITGVSPVPDGTTVQLIRMNAIGTTFSVLASTPTSGGHYSFNLTNLGVQPSSDLVVRVANGSVQMRAFVTGSNVDLDPVSETTVQLVLEQILATPTATINRYTVQELADITGSVNLLSTVKELTAGLDLQNTIASIKSAVTAEPSLITFMNAAATDGQTTEGPGDIGNYFLLADGMTWTFQGTHSGTGMPTVNFTNRMTVRGTKPIGGVIASVLVEDNPLNSGNAEETYYLKDSRGILNYGNNDATDTLSPKLIPYREILFPLIAGVTSAVVNKNGVDFGQDLDLPPDGKNEFANVIAQVTVEKFEDVTVPKGTFSHVAKLVQKATITVFSSAGAGSATIVSTQTIWVAPGIGPVKRQILIQNSGGQSMESSTEELLDVFIAKQISLATNDIIYDSFRNKIYASVPGNPGSIALINPDTGMIETSLLVGNEPRKLAISGDGKFLYVGLYNETSVQRIDLASGTVDLKFPLIANPYSGFYWAEDMEVLPGSSASVAIAHSVAVSGAPLGFDAIYDNGVPRPKVGIYAGSKVIEFSQSGSTLYTCDCLRFNTLSVDQSGVTLANSTVNIISDPFWTVDIKFQGGLIYASNGQIIDPVALQSVGTFQLPGSSSIRDVRPVVDPPAGRVVFLAQGISGPSAVTLSAFDQHTFQLLGSIAIEGPSGKASSLIRVNANGLAFRTTGGQVFLVQSPKLIP